MASCKKCKKEIPDGALYCQWCGAAQKKNPKKKMYQRPDGLFEQSKVIDGKRVVFRGKTEKEVADIPADGSDADLAALCTISIDALQKAAGDAFENASL